MSLFTFGKASQDALIGLHPELVRIAHDALAVSKVDFSVNEGLRTEARQEALFKEGRTKTHHSKHFKNPADGLGHAMDLVPYVGGVKRFDDDAWPYFYEIAVAVRSVLQGTPVTWGAVWDRLLQELPGDLAGIQAAQRAYGRRHPGPDFYDGPHFQLGRN